MDKTAARLSPSEEERAIEAVVAEKPSADYVAVAEQAIGRALSMDGRWVDTAMARPILHDLNERGLIKPFPVTPAVNKFEQSSGDAMVVCGWRRVGRDTGE